jgi:hypothetical protein
MEHSKWAAARGVVAGRLINCYAWNDWMLALLYRSKSYEIGVAGLYPILLQAGDNSRVASTAASHALKETFTAGGAVAVAEGAGVEALEPSCEAGAVTPAPASASGRLGVKRGAGALEVENCDVSHLISSHTDYPNVMPAIIAMLKL